MITIKWMNYGFVISLESDLFQECDQKIAAYLNIDLDIFHELVKKYGGFTNSNINTVVFYSRFKLFCQAEEMLEALQPYIIMKEISG